jgi:hypothetical protein
MGKINFINLSYSNIFLCPQREAYSNCTVRLSVRLKRQSCKILSSFLLQNRLRDFMETSQECLSPSLVLHNIRSFHFESWALCHFYCNFYIKTLSTLHLQNPLEAFTEISPECLSPSLVVHFFRIFRLDCF